jgi:hypothetical protein
MRVQRHIYQSTSNKHRWRRFVLGCSPIFVAGKRPTKSGAFLGIRAYATEQKVLDEVYGLRFCTCGKYAVEP